MIKHVSFDLWGTLIKSNLEFKKARTQIFADVTEEKHRYVEATVRRVEKLVDSLNEECTGHITTQQIIGMILNKLGTSPKKELVDNICRKILLSFIDNPPELITGNVHHILSSIKEMGISMNILSNTGMIPGSILRDILKPLNSYLIFDFMLFSDEGLQISKPNRKFFGQVIETCPYDIVSANILHVGDNPYTDGACTKVGIEFYDLTKHSLDNLLDFIKTCNSQDTPQSTLVIT